MSLVFFLTTWSGLMISMLCGELFLAETMTVASAAAALWFLAEELWR